MKKDKDYIKDINEIKNMMERSSKFMSLSGLSGIIAGIYALIASYIIYSQLNFKIDRLYYTDEELLAIGIQKDRIILLAIVTIVLAIGTAIYFSYKNALKNSEKIWNVSSRRLLINLFIPLITGGTVLLLMMEYNLYGWLAPLTLVFYGLAILNASKYTFDDMRGLGIIQIVLGLIGMHFISYGLLIWAIGFGLVHIIYGIYLHYKYEVESNN